MQLVIILCLLALVIVCMFGLAYNAKVAQQRIETLELRVYAGLCAVSYYRHAQHLAANGAEPGAVQRCLHVADQYANKAENPHLIDIVA